MKNQKETKPTFPSKLEQGINEFFHTSAWFWTVIGIGAGVYGKALYDYITKIKP